MAGRLGDQMSMCKKNAKNVAQTIFAKINAKIYTKGKK
jgi:hypothetical protein